MDEYQKHHNGEHGSARVQDFDVPPDARGTDGKQPRPDGDPGRIATFEAKAEEPGKNADARGTDGKQPRPDGDPGRIATFEAKAEAGRYVSAWPQQVAGFYGMRLRKNFEFGRRVAEAEGIGDLFGLQREYVSDMLHDYASSFRSVYGMAGFGLLGPRQTTERLDR